MDDDGKQDADFETLANMQASRFRFRWWRHQHEDQKTIITPRAKRKPSMDDDGKQDADFETLANMQASRFRFRWWRHQHEDQKTIITPRPKRKQ